VLTLGMMVDIVGMPEQALTSTDARWSTIHRPYYYND
jgi:hypothetical protein